MANKEQSPKHFICFCNQVTYESVENAIAKGASSLAQIYDQTGAGSGPCGGSCRNNLQALLAQGKTPPHPMTEKEQLPDEVIKAISLFNRRFYWETHEVLEDLWMVETGELKIFYQGLIQASAAFYHVLNANPKGAIKLAQDSLAKLQPFSPVYKGIELKPLCEKLSDFAQEAKEILGNERSNFNFDLLPKLRIQGEMKI